MNKISILVANYNNGKYFRDCYNSIISQNYENWEAVIVDDCSTDDSVHLIKALIGDDSRFRFFINEKNEGCGYTKRKCVELAEGNFCAFLDPDDALYDYALECSADELTKSAKTIAVYSKLIFCDADLRPGEVFGKIKQIHNSKYFFNIPIQMSAFFMFKRSAYLKTSGIDRKLKSAVDQDLYLKLLETGEARFIDEVLYKYRIHDQGISQSSSKQNAKDSFAGVIWESMKRRKITTIHHKPVPAAFTTSKEIYDLLEYQTKIPYRLISRIRSTLHI